MLHQVLIDGIGIFNLSLKSDHVFMGQVELALCLLLHAVVSVAGVEAAVVTIAAAIAAASAASKDEQMAKTNMVVADQCYFSCCTIHRLHQDHMLLLEVSVFESVVQGGDSVWEGL
nr:branched-chain-amino-acid aminotransferase-like protein 2 [Tanacetum cinerariifolium]